MAQAPTQDFIVNSGLNVQGTSTVTSSTGNTGTLQVDGGAAVAKNLIVGNGALIYGGLEVWGTVPNLTITTGTFTDLTVTGLSTLNAVTAGITTASQLDVASRLAVGGLSQLNNVTLSNQTNSTSSTTGALQVSGGVGIQKDLWVGGHAYVNGYEVITTATVIASTLQAVTEQGSSTTVAISVLNTTSSTSTNSGALTVVGGVGIGGTLNVAGNTSFANNVSVGGTNNTLTQLTVLGNATTATASLGLFNSGQYGYSGGQIYLGDQTYITGIATWQTAPGIGAIYDNAIHGGSPGGLGLYTDNGSNRTLRMSIDSYGLVKILSTTTQANATSTNTGALQVIGGVGIGGALYVGTASYINGSLILTTATVDLYATKTSILAGTDTAVNTSTGIVTIWNTSTLQSVTNRGSTTSNIIVITNTQSSTSTVAGNALQVSGGVGIDGSLFVAGPAYFLNSVLFAGTSTYVFSTNTYYTDNLINIHQPNIDPMVNWTVDDGKDVGHIYHYYKGADYNAFLGLANTTGYLEWYNQGTEVGGIFTGTSYGTFKTGAIILTSNTASVSTSTGALTVRGGVGVGGAINVANTSYIGGSRILVAGDLETVITHPVYITNNPALVAVSGTSTTYGTYNTGTIASILTASDYISPGGYYSINDTATTPGYIAYVGFTTVTNFTRLVANVNYTVGSTHTIDIDLYNYLTSSWDTFAVYSGTTNYYQFVLQVDNDTPYISSGVVTARFYHASFGNTGHETRIDYVALEDSIQGGQGPRGATGATGAQGPQGLTTSTTSTFIFFNTTSASSTSSAAVVAYGGVGIGGDLRVGGTIYGVINGTGSVSTATNIANGTAGQLVYQSAPGVTSFVTTASAGQILVSSGTNSPLYVSTSNIYVGRAALADNASTSTTATNLTAGTAGQVPYQTAPGVTSFYGPGTAGQLLVSSGTNAPVYTNTSSIYVGRADAANTATTATNLASGTAGQVPYQSSTGTTSFFGPGTAGNVLVSNGTSAPSYNNTLTLAGTTASTGTSTGALQVRGGVGVAGSVYVGSRVGFVNTAGNASVVYQFYNTATNSLDTVFG